MAKHVVATVDEIPPGERKIVELEGRSLGIFNINGEFYAVRNICPHQGAPLCEGRLTGLLQSDVPGEYRYTRKGEILRCVWHGWEFRYQNRAVVVEPSTEACEEVPGRGRGRGYSGIRACKRDRTPPKPIPYPSISSMWSLTCPNSRREFSDFHCQIA